MEPSARASRVSCPYQRFVIMREIVTFDPFALPPAGTIRNGKQSSNGRIYATIQAEASGVTRAHVDMMSSSEDPRTGRLLTKSGGLERERSGSKRSGWRTRSKAVGNYGEMFERDGGQRSPLKLDRGMSALWTKGGLMYPLPSR